MPTTTSHQHLLNKHHELDYHCRNPGNRIFVSDWYCKHPYVRKYIPQNIFTETNLTDKDLLYYCFPNDEYEVHEEIRKFHQKHDGITYENDEIYIGAGMTPLITAQVIMMMNLGYTEFHYTKPPLPEKIFGFKKLSGLIKRLGTDRGAHVQEFFQGFQDIGLIINNQHSFVI